MPTAGSVRRAVLDPNVLISGLISPQGAPAQLLGELRSGSFELVTSPQLLAELEGVLRRDKFRRYVTSEDVEEFVAVIRRESQLHSDPPIVQARLSADPRDEYLIVLVRAAGDVLVSGDPHLTRLRDVIPVRTPREFLDEISPKDARA